MLPLVAKVKDSDDVGVAEAGCGLGLALKTGQEFLVSGYRGVEELDRHVALEGRLNGFVDPGHAAFANQFHELIVA